MTVVTIAKGFRRAPITGWLPRVIAALGLLCGGMAQATSIYVSPGMPDISAGGITWDYGDEYGGGRSASTGAGDYRLFQVTSGLPTSYIDPVGDSFPIYAGTLDLIVGIDALRGIDPAQLAANTVNGTDNLIISGRFTPFVGPVEQLLTATISLLKDPSDNPDALQFVANVTGGTLASAYGGIGGEFVIFANATGIGGPWTGTPFVLESGSGDFATELVPVPGSIALLLLGIAAMRSRFVSLGAGRSAS